jgi:NADPH-dependent 2,4-dienoyl-CoA reductase/sulfur reductase-like enzyme
MYVFMGHMRYADTKPFPDALWAEQRLDLVRAWVTKIDVAGHRLELACAPPIHWDRLLVATGSKPNRFGWKGQDLEGVQGLWGLQDLELLRRNAERARHAVIVGGGLIGIELAEMLHSRGIHVTFLVREESYWDNILPKQESRLVNRVIERQGIGLRFRTQLREVVDDGRGRVGGIVTDQGESIACQLVGLTTGVSPNLDVVQGSSIPTGRGVLVDRELCTGVPDVWAAGDCAEIAGEAGSRSLVQQVWYTGKRQGECAGDGIAGAARRYEPGVWFNSAKFFDLEYQTYGQVNLNVAGEQSLYWEHASGRFALRLVHVGGRVIGLNFMGLRASHVLCERWIRERLGVADVIARLEECRFDPEFGARHLRTAARALREGLAAEAVPA